MNQLLGDKPLANSLKISQLADFCHVQLRVKKKKISNILSTSTLLYDHIIDSNGIVSKIDANSN